MKKIYKKHPTEISLLIIVCMLIYITALLVNPGIVLIGLIIAFIGILVFVYFKNEK